MVFFVQIEVDGKERRLGFIRLNNETSMKFYFFQE